MFEVADLVVLLVFCGIPLAIGNYLMVTAEPFSDGTLATGEKFPDELRAKGHLRILAEVVVFLAIVCVLGLYVAKHAGVNAIALTNPGVSLAGRLLRIVGAGIVFGLISAIVFDVLRFVAFYDHLKSWDGDVCFRRWRPFCGAALWAGVLEELLFRLVLLSSLAWVASFWWADTDGKPASPAFWVANVLASLVMAASHMSLVGSEVPFTIWNATKWIAIVTVVSLLLGYVYWHYGFEASVICHGSSILLGWLYGSLWKHLRPRADNSETCTGGHQ